MNDIWKLKLENIPITLRQMVEGYADHTELHFGEIQELIDKKSDI